MSDNFTKNNKALSKLALYCQNHTFKKWWVWLIILIVLIAIPIGINIAYMKGLHLQEPNTAFTASDWLSFYGTIISGLITLIALYATIRFTAHQSIRGRSIKLRFF